MPMKNILNKTANAADVIIFAIAFCIPLWPLGTIILTMLWLALSLISFSKKSFIEGVKAKPFLILFACYFLMHIIGLVWTSNVSHGWKEIKDDLNLLIFPILLQ